jgi:hypothetical protein
VSTRSRTTIASSLQCAAPLGQSRRRPARLDRVHTARDAPAPAYIRPPRAPIQLTPLLPPSQKLRHSLAAPPSPSSAPTSNRRSPVCRQPSGASRRVGHSAPPPVTEAGGGLQAEVPPLLRIAAVASAGRRSRASPRCRPRGHLQAAASHGPPRASPATRTGRGGLGQAPPLPCLIAAVPVALR